MEPNRFLRFDRSLPLFGRFGVCFLAPPLIPPYRTGFNLFSRYLAAFITASGHWLFRPLYRKVTALKLTWRFLNHGRWGPYLHLRHKVHKVKNHILGSRRKNSRILLYSHCKTVQDCSVTRWLHTLPLALSDRTPQACNGFKLSSRLG